MHPFIRSTLFPRLLALWTQGNKKTKNERQKTRVGEKTRIGQKGRHADDPRWNGGLVLGALAGHLHGLRSGLVVEDRAASGALHLWTGVCAAARAVRWAHAGGGVSARSCQSGHTGSGHWEREERNRRELKTCTREMTVGGSRVRGVCFTRMCTRIQTYGDPGRGE